jgi:large subunit ribosomal protein L15
MKKIIHKKAVKETKETKASDPQAAKAKPKPVVKKFKKAVKREEKKVTFGLHNLPVPNGAHKKKKLLGRGSGSGHGKTSTRGSKGQTSRAGRHFYLGFEGGQSPLIRRMPKFGFNPPAKKGFQLVNLKDLNKIKETPVTLELLEIKGLIEDKSKLVKVLGDGEIKHALTVQAHAFSKRAKTEIEKAGGKIEIINA